MSAVALLNITHILPEEAFDGHWWLQPFGLDMDKALSEYVPAHFVDGVEALTWAGSPGIKPFPLPAGQPHCALRLMPDARAGLAALLAQVDGRPALTAVWPFATGGGEHELEIKQVLMAPNQMQAVIVANLRGVMDIAWMDVMFPVDRGFYAEGSRHMASLAGIAHQFTVGAAESMRIGPGHANYAALREQYPQWLQADGAIEMPTTGMASMFPLKDAPPGVYSIQGPVKQVALYPETIFDREIWELKVTGLRLEGVVNPDIDLTILVSDLVLNGRAPPRIGDDMNAVVRLQGRITWPNLQLT